MAFDGDPIRMLVRLTEKIQTMKSEISKLENERERIREHLERLVGKAVQAKGIQEQKQPHGALQRSVQETLEAAIAIGGLIDKQIVAERLKITEHNAAVRLSRCVRAGLLERVQPGKYRVSGPNSNAPETPPEREPLSS